MAHKQVKDGKHLRRGAGDHQAAYVRIRSCSVGHQPPPTASCVAFSFRCVSAVRPVPPNPGTVWVPLSTKRRNVAQQTHALWLPQPTDRAAHTPPQIGVPQAVSWAYGRRWPSKHLARGDSAVFFVPEADSLWGMGGANATNATANATAANGT